MATVHPLPAPATEQPRKAEAAGVQSLAPFVRQPEEQDFLHLSEPLARPTAAQTNLMQADAAQVSTQLSRSETQQTALENVIAQLNSTSNNIFSKLSQ